MEQQPLAAAQRDDLDEVLGRAGVLLAAGLARVDVRAQPDVCDEPRPAGGDLAHELRQHALRERVRLELVVLDERPRRGSLPMLLPIVRRIRPGSPSCEKPRSAKSPIPTTRTVRSRGRPSSLYTAASSSMKRCGRACPAPEPPITIVAPSRTFPTASRTPITFDALTACTRRRSG